MSEQKIETETIVRDGSTIIIAHPHVKQETNYWELFTGLFRSDTSSRDVSLEQPIVKTDVQQFPFKVTKISVQPISTQALIEEKQQSQAQVSEDWKQWLKVFSSQNIAEYRKFLNNKISQFDGVDERLSRDISKFKEKHILTLGDIRIRSIFMAISSALLYTLVSNNTTGLLRKSRNLGLSFVFMGYWFTPDLFNPFLRRPSLVHQVI